MTEATEGRRSSFAVSTRCISARLVSAFEKAKPNETENQPRQPHCRALDRIPGRLNSVR
jgi:hypothetical protein